MNTKSILSTASALLLAATLSAQGASLYTDFDLQSPTSGTLITGVYGMPRDLAIVAVGPQIASGVQTPFGTLFLNPAHLIVLGSFPLDGEGAGRLLVPFELKHVVSAQLGVQAVTIGAGPRFAASKDDTVYVDMGPAFAWLSTCTMDKKGKLKVSFSGAPGTKIEIIHNNGTRAGNTPVWSGTIPKPPQKNRIKSGLKCPPSWKRGESIIIKVDGKVIRTIPWK